MKNATVNISLRVPTKQARLLEKAARLSGQPLATFVRAAALERAEHDLALDNWATEAQEARPT